MIFRLHFSVPLNVAVPKEKYGKIRKKNVNKKGEVGHFFMKRGQLAKKDGGLPQIKIKGGS